MSTVTDSDVYKAALDHSRQLSALRFAILTVFMTATGALFNAYFTPTVHYPLRVVSFAGFWLAIVFLVCEIVLSFTMAKQNSVAEAKAGEKYKDAFLHRRWLALWSIRLAIPSVYVLSGAYWFYLFFLWVG